MDFTPTAEQQALGELVQRFLSQEYGFEARRRILRSPEGWSRAVWSKLAELGLLALQAPEEHGGLHPANVELLLTMTAIGKALLVEPYLSSAVLATALVRELGSPDQQAVLLPLLVAGEKIAAPALGEPGARYDLAQVATSAVREGSGWRLRGHKAVVLHAPAADVLLVSARTSGALDDQAGVSLFLVPRDAAGVGLVPYRTFDGCCAAEVALASVALPADALLGPEGGASSAISAAADLGIAALCAEAVGTLQAALDLTLEYARLRKQFGQPLARFQALQHRMADMLIHVEQARSMSYLAAMHASEPDVRKRRRALSAAKVVIGQACRFVSQQAVQLHGGIGMTDEAAISHYFRRLAAIEHTLGDTEHHLERFVAEGATEAA